MLQHAASLPALPWAHEPPTGRAVGASEEGMQPSAFAKTKEAHRRPGWEVLAERPSKRGHRVLLFLSAESPLKASVHGASQQWGLTQHYWRVQGSPSRVRPGPARPASLKWTHRLCLISLEPQTLRTAALRTLQMKGTSETLSQMSFPSTCPSCDPELVLFCFSSSPDEMHCFGGQLPCLVWP